MENLLVYGSYGYTGDLIVREAVSRGGNPGVAGRDPDRVAAQAAEFGLDSRSFGVDSASIAREIGAFDAVLNCAGPFVDTSEPIVEACLETGTDYLDITGEFEVFARLADLDDRAEAAGVTILPGVGFDVVPSDCLAAFLHELLPSANRLALGVRSGSSISRGTALTMLDSLGEGGLIRRNGRLVRVPSAYRTREIDFGRGPEPAVTIPWGDVVTAFHSTGIENVEVYGAVPRGAASAMNAVDAVDWLVGTRPVRAALERVVEAACDGPDESERETDEAAVWGEVVDEDDPEGERSAIARLRTPNPYALTVDAAVTAADRILAGEVSTGYRTPSTAFGAKFALELEGVEREVVRDPTDESD